MAGVEHTPHLEKRPSGYFFRRRLPKAWVEISNPGQSSAICLSLRTDVLSEATCRVRALTALTDLAVALTTERPVDHLSAEHVTLLTELARCQIAAHEALRACTEPRSEAAANFAAQTERATQDMLRRALALGDRTPVTEPLREMARQFGVTLDETSSDWRALAFEALRVMLDVSRERERREVGTYEEATPIFRSVMASRLASPATALPVAASDSSAPPWPSRQQPRQSRFPCRCQRCRRPPHRPNQRWPVPFRTKSRRSASSPKPQRSISRTIAPVRHLPRNAPSFPPPRRRRRRRCAP